MDLLLSLHDQTVLDELSDEYSGVGLTDLFDFTGIDPDSLMSAFKHFSGNSLLTLKANHWLL